MWFFCFLFFTHPEKVFPGLQSVHKVLSAHIYAGVQQIQPFSCVGVEHFLKRDSAMRLEIFFAQIPYMRGTDLALFRGRIHYLQF